MTPQLLPCGYAANGGSWIRWAIGLTLAGMFSSLGFAINEVQSTSALRQQVLDDKDRSAQERADLRDEMRYRMDKLDEQIAMLTRVVIDQSSRTAVASQPKRPPVFGPESQLTGKPK